MVLKPIVKKIGKKIPTSTGEFAGCLNHQQYLHPSRCFFHDPMRPNFAWSSCNLWLSRSFSPLESTVLRAQQESPIMMLIMITIMNMIIIIIISIISIISIIIIDHNIWCPWPPIMTSPTNFIIIFHKLGRPSNATIWGKHHPSNHDLYQLTAKTSCDVNLHEIPRWVSRHPSTVKCFFKRKHVKTTKRIYTRQNLGILLKVSTLYSGLRLTSIFEYHPKNKQEAGKPLV